MIHISVPYRSYYERTGHRRVGVFGIKMVGIAKYKVFKILKDWGKDKTVLTLRMLQ